MDLPCFAKSYLRKKKLEECVYKAESILEEKHWWFVARRKLFSKIITKCNLEKSSIIVDLGSGTGANLRLLKNNGFRNVQGIDSSHYAIEYCRMKNLPPVKQADICHIPIEDSTVDFILATDVLEHVDDKKAVLEIYRILKPGGKALITVPMFKWLWGIQDELSHHKRRYKKNDIIHLFDDNKFKKLKIKYFNFFLLPYIFLIRKIIKLLNIKLKSENEINNYFLNKILLTIFSVDVFFSQYINYPLGVSLYIIVERK